MINAAIQDCARRFGTTSSSAMTAESGCSASIAEHALTSLWRKSTKPQVSSSQSPVMRGCIPSSWRVVLVVHGRERRC
jgi:hypothetical protein